jgi:hypothetical protein
MHRFSVTLPDVAGAPDDDDDTTTASTQRPMFVS